jgi:hypothetical protein
MRQAVNDRHEVSMSIEYLTASGMKGKKDNIMRKENMITNQTR